MTYTITQEQLQIVINKIAEAPAKFVFDSIVILQNLPKVDKEIDKK
jgi:hypothetical protein